ncbi:hypothetical protein PHYPSEUDO_013569 [Phytophthora pseudosyringae]|uniref:Uncharacterized protein n=1 Tax=Phytophthora pseudosyringae TaxID=221518 RepID=A0A8T1V5Y1_9STRA|nr:hypothetical protein PHYPSEUDO_013569 [Phytophthora pseudosyringae]
MLSMPEEDRDMDAITLRVLDLIPVRRNSSRVLNRFLRAILRRIIVNVHRTSRGRDRQVVGMVPCHRPDYSHRYGRASRCHKIDAVRSQPCPTLSTDFVGCLISAMTRAASKFWSTGLLRRN